jgi:MipA family protein
VPRGRISQIAAVLILLLRAAVTFAADECTDDCVAVGHWNFSIALGAGVRTNPLVRSQDIPLVIVPQFSYYGSRFFIDNLDPGVTLFEGRANTVSLVASPGYDRVFFYRRDLQNIFVGAPFSSAGAAQRPAVVTSNTRDFVPPEGFKQVPLPTPKITYLAGPEWTFKWARVSGQLDVLHEITGHNHGDEVRAALGIPLGELAGSWSTSVGVTWKSSRIVNYYYGYPGIYDAGWALNPFAKLGYSRPLSSKWKLDAFVHCERLGNAIADSPLIKQHYVTTAFIGATYVFHE